MQDFRDRLERSEFQDLDKSSGKISRKWLVSTTCTTAATSTGLGAAKVSAIDRSARQQLTQQSQAVEHLLIQ